LDYKVSIMDARHSYFFVNNASGGMLEKTINIFDAEIRSLTTNRSYKTRLKSEQKNNIRKEAFCSKSSIYTFDKKLGRLCLKHPICKNEVDSVEWNSIVQHYHLLLKSCSRFLLNCKLNSSVLKFSLWPNENQELRYYNCASPFN